MNGARRIRLQIMKLLAVCHEIRREIYIFQNTSGTSESEGNLYSLADVTPKQEAAMRKKKNLNLTVRADFLIVPLDGGKRQQQGASVQELMRYSVILQKITGRKSSFLTSPDSISPLFVNICAGAAAR